MHCGVMFRTMQIQGWTPDFIPLITENALAMGLVDEVLPIAGEAAIATSSRLAKEEGIFTGISGGATMATALNVAANLDLRGRALSLENFSKDVAKAIGIVTRAADLTFEFDPRHVLMEKRKRKPLMDQLLTS